MKGPSIMFLVNSRNGVYIPSVIAERFLDPCDALRLKNPREEILMDLEYLKEDRNKEEDDYFETYERVLEESIIYKGREYSLYHEEDVWAVATDLAEWEDFTDLLERESHSMMNLYY